MSWTKRHRSIVESAQLAVPPIPSSKGKPLKRTAFSGEDQKRFWAKVEIKKADECWPWLAWRDKLGYGDFDYPHGRYRAHRLAYLFGNGDIDTRNVCHSCDNPSCCNPSHLWLGTQQENMIDMRSKGRGFLTSGTKNWSAKLTDEQVHQIRRDRSDGIYYKITLEKFGIKRAAYYSIVGRRAWKHI